MTGHRASKRDIFHDEEGFSTVGVVLALLITLALIFTSAQVYQINTASADIQEVADSSALAAENVVGDYYVVARVCDAVVLSLSLTGLAVTGAGVAALCTPVTASVSAKLLETGAKILRARDGFARKAASGLNALQEALPFIAAARSSAVVSANKETMMGSSYFGFALLMPLDGETVSVGAQGAADKLLQDIDEQRDAIQEAADKAEEASKEANIAKEKGYLHDCGNNPDYCMYERAASLSSLPSSENPLYRSVDAWDFSVALKRAQAYYPRRLAQESPSGSSVDEQANSALRRIFYEYAASRVATGYVHESGEGTFEASFPLLPKNTEEMRGTELYTQSRYPVTVGESGAMSMHAWSGCPNAVGSIGLSSLADFESGEYEVCPLCEFDAGSMGKVAAASTSIENGFEYHYVKVAEAAAEYQAGRERAAPEAQAVKSKVGNLFSDIGNCFKEMASVRIAVSPPGRYGAVSFVAGTDLRSASSGFENSFVASTGALGTRAAISAAVLVSDDPEQGATVISSILDGLKNEAGFLGVGVLDSVFDLWSTLLFAYTQGQEALEQGIGDLLNAIPFASASGLGTWASSALKDLAAGLGLQPVEMDAPRPVLVNSNHVLAADSSSLAVHVLSLKKQAAFLSGDDVFSGAINVLEREAIQSVESIDGEVTIATIEFAGEGGPSLPLTIVLPESVKSSSVGAIEGLADRLQGIVGSVTGRRQWQ